MLTAKCRPPFPSKLLFPHLLSRLAVWVGELRSPRFPKWPGPPRKWNGTHPRAFQGPNGRVVCRGSGGVSGGGDALGPAGIRSCQIPPLKRTVGRCCVLDGRMKGGGASQAKDQNRTAGTVPQHPQGSTQSADEKTEKQRPTWESSWEKANFSAGSLSISLESVGRGQQSLELALPAPHSDPHLTVNPFSPHSPCLCEGWTPSPESFPVLCPPGFHLGIRLSDFSLSFTLPCRGLFP